jgi:hypothetical protein
VEIDIQEEDESLEEKIPLPKETIGLGVLNPRPEHVFSDALAQLAKNMLRMHDAIVASNACYTKHDKVMAEYRDCMDRTEKLYLETLKTIERVWGKKPDCHPDCEIVHNIECPNSTAMKHEAQRNE